MLSLRDIAFTDLFLESDFSNSRIRGYERSSDLLPIPEELRDDVRKLYKHVESTHRQTDESLEFSVPHEDVMYRVSVIPDVRQKVFALRRGALHMPPFGDVGITPVIADRLLALECGLVLFSGTFAAGKTTAASAFVIEKTIAGGLSITLEDPPELSLSGDHGKGRCLQVPIERDKIDKAIEATLRMSFDLLFVSEVRTAKIAAELINASVNGKLIVSTIHSDGAVSAVSRLAALAAAGAGVTGGESSAQARVFREMLANGLGAVVHMAKVGSDKREASEYLLGGQDLRSRIASGEFQSLQNTVNSLKNRIHYGQPLE